MADPRIGVIVVAAGVGFAVRRPRCPRRSSRSSGRSLLAWSVRRRRSAAPASPWSSSSPHLVTVVRGRAARPTGMPTVPVRRRSPAAPSGPTPWRPGWPRFRDDVDDRARPRRRPRADAVRAVRRRGRRGRRRGPRRRARDSRSSTPSSRSTSPGRSWRPRPGPRCGRSRRPRASAATCSSAHTPRPARTGDRRRRPGRGARRCRSSSFPGDPRAHKITTPDDLDRVVALRDSGGPRDD